MKIQTSRYQGFTLVELLIAMVVAGIVLAAIYNVYIVQQRHYIAQSQVTEMQQNIRAAMNLITRDIRMAGYDPSDGASAEIVRSEADLLYFTVDFNEDGDLNDSGEHIVYDIYTDATGLSTLGRATSDTAFVIYDEGGGHFEAKDDHIPAAQVIEHLQFSYLDEDGNTTITPAKVKTIIVEMIARAELADPKFTNAATYPIGGPWPTGDNFRRRYHQMTIQCRNLGF